ncbi:hypothetical protein [Streptomyces sp. SCL15-6]|uniref:hypothetical protein n=1 Tax=Streptomyces sp. SCL15-6 TaxID=2967222 RepID=UPI002966AECA|nr:hypothetical protein [Streptomyces sp. SCL15-6]
MIVAQVVQFLFEWASTLVLAIFNPVQAAVEQAFLRALYRLILRSLLLRLLATVAAYEGLNVGLSSVMDLLVRWSLAADGRSTRYGGRYASQAAGFGAVQGAFAVFVPYVGSSIAGLLAKDIRQSIESVVGQGLAAGGLGAKSLGSKELGGEGLGGQVAVGLGRDADEAVGGSGPVGGFARDLAASVAGVAQRFEMGEVGDAVAFSFREGMGDLFARQYGHVLGGGAARALGEGWAQAFVRSFGSRDLGGELFRSLGTLGAAEFQSLRSALSHGVADALSADWSRKVSGYAGDAVANAGHQNVSEGFYNLFTTGRFTTSWETGTSGAAGGMFSHLVSANAHLIGRGLRSELGLGGTDKFTVVLPPEVVNAQPQSGPHGTAGTGTGTGAGVGVGVGKSSFLITPKHDTTTTGVPASPVVSTGGQVLRTVGRFEAQGDYLRLQPLSDRLRSRLEEAATGHTPADEPVPHQSMLTASNPEESASAAHGLQALRTHTYKPEIPREQFPGRGNGIGDGTNAAGADTNRDRGPAQGTATGLDETARRIEDVRRSLDDDLTGGGVERPAELRQETATSVPRLEQRIVQRDLPAQREQQDVESPGSELERLPLSHSVPMNRLGVAEASPGLAAEPSKSASAPDIRATLSGDRDGIAGGEHRAVDADRRPDFTAQADAVRQQAAEPVTEQRLRPPWETTGGTHRLSDPPAAPQSARHGSGVGVPEGEVGGVAAGSFAAALAQALRSGGVQDEGVTGVAGWATAGDVHRALRAWAREELLLRGVPEGVRLAAGDDPVSVGELARVGVRLTPAQQARAVLQGDVLPASEVGLTRGQRIELLLDDTGSPAYADAMAALVARAVGREVVIGGLGTDSRRFGPETAAGAPLRLHFDGAAYFAVTGSGEVSTERWRRLADGSGRDPFVLDEAGGRRRWASAEGTGERTLVGYAWTWHEGVGGRPPVVVMTRRLFLSAVEGAGAAELERVRQVVPGALDEYVNARGYRLPVWPERLRARWDTEAPDPAAAERDTQAPGPVVGERDTQVGAPVVGEQGAEARGPAGDARSTEVGGVLSERAVRFDSERDMVDGPVLRLRVEFVDDPGTAHEEAVQVRPGKRGAGQVMDQSVWFAGEDPLAFVHELLHGFGVADDPRTEDQDRPGRSLMGHRWGPDLGLTPHHLRQIAEVHAPSAHPARHSAPELTWHGPTTRQPADIAPAVDPALLDPEDQGNVVESQEDEILWHFSDAPPGTVLSTGLTASNAQDPVPVWWHLQDPSGQFISTTRDRELWYKNRRYRYEIHPRQNWDQTGVDINATMALHPRPNGSAYVNARPYEEEVAFVGRIDPQAIAQVLDRVTGLRGVWDATQGTVRWSLPDDLRVVSFTQGSKKLSAQGKQVVADLASRLVAAAGSERPFSRVRTVVRVTGFGNGGRSGESRAMRTGQERADAVKQFLVQRIAAELRRAPHDVRPGQFTVVATSGGFTGEPVLSAVAATSSQQLRSVVIRLEHPYDREIAGGGAAGLTFGVLGEPPAVGVAVPGEVTARAVGVDWFAPLPDSAAVAVARELIVVPEGVRRPVAARMQLTRLLAAMLSAPDTAARIRDSAVRVVVIPRDVPVTDLLNAAEPAHAPHYALHETPNGVVRAESAENTKNTGGAQAAGLPRGLTLPRAGLVAVSEENLLGEYTTTDPHRPFQAEGYSSVTHELAHMIHHFALTPQDRRLVQSAFEAKTRAGTTAHWADGPLTGPDPTTRNHSSRNAEEYFAQTTNAYLGTNHGHDPHTGLPRNNGAPWVHANEPILLPLLQRLHGTHPTPIPHPNPLALTTAEHTHWQNYRDFTTLTTNNADSTTPTQSLHQHTPTPPTAPPATDQEIGAALTAYTTALRTVHHAQIAHHTALQRHANHGESSSTDPTDPTHTHTALTHAHTALTHAETALHHLGVHPQDLHISDDDLRAHPRLPGGGQDHSRPFKGAAHQGTGDAGGDTAQAVFERDLRAIRYLEASEEFERRLAAHIVTAQPAVAEEIRVLVRAAWRLVRKHSPDRLVRFGSSDATLPGGVGTNRRVLEDRMLHGNLREHMAMLYHATFGGAFREMFEIPRHPVIEEQRTERRRTPRLPTWERPEAVRPPLSEAERAFAVRVDGDGRQQLLWARGEQFTQMPFSGRLHQQSKTVGGLVSTGVSGSTLGLLQAAKEISAWTGVRVDMRLVRLAAIGVYVGVGHHTMHEVMLAAQLWDEGENRVHGLGYADDVRRYRRIAPLSEDHLRTHVAPGGVFPDLHVLPDDGYRPLAGPGRSPAGAVAGPAATPRYASVDDARRGFERAAAALTPLETGERQQFLRAAATIMVNRHQSPPVDRTATTPGEAAYRELYIDIMRAVAYELLVNDGRHEARQRAHAVSEELRALFGTRRTHGAPGGAPSGRGVTEAAGSGAGSSRDQQFPQTGGGSRPHAGAQALAGGERDLAARQEQVDIVRNWRKISAVDGKKRSDTLQGIDAAVQELNRFPYDGYRLRAVLAAIAAWESAKSAASVRHEVVADLKRHINSRISELASASRAQATARLAGMLGLTGVPEVPGYWNDLQWRMGNGGLFYADLPREHPVFKAVERYTRESQDDAPYTSPAGERTRMEAVRNRLSAPNAAGLSAGSRRLLQNRLLEGRTGGPPPPTSRHMAIIRIEVVANPGLWTRYATNKRLFQKSFVEKSDTAFLTSPSDPADRVAWSTSSPPDLGGTARSLALPQLAHPTDAGRIVTPEDVRGEVFLFHGTSPEIIDSIRASGFRPDLSANKGTEERPKYGPLGQGVYLADNASKAQTYDVCPVCLDYDCVDGTHPPRQMLLNRALLGAPTFARFHRSMRQDDHTTLKMGRSSVVSQGLKKFPLKRGASGSNEILVKDAPLLYPEFRIFYRVVEDRKQVPPSSSTSAVRPQPARPTQADPAPSGRSTGHLRGGAPQSPARTADAGRPTAGPSTSADEKRFAAAVQEEPVLAGLAPDRVRQAFAMLQRALPPVLSIDDDAAAAQARVHRLRHARDIAVALDEGGRLAAEEVLRLIIGSGTTVHDPGVPHGGNL